MIDCLSNPEWIKPQMDFLVFLQNIRINNFEIWIEENSSIIELSIIQDVLCLFSSL